MDVWNWASLHCVISTFSWRETHCVIFFRDTIHQLPVLSPLFIAAHFRFICRVGLFQNIHYICATPTSEVQCMLHDMKLGWEIDGEAGSFYTYMGLWCHKTLQIWTIMTWFQFEAAQTKLQGCVICQSLLGFFVFFCFLIIMSLWGIQRLPHHRLLLAWPPEGYFIQSLILFSSFMATCNLIKC